MARPGADIGLTTDRKQFKPFLAQTLTCSLKFSEVLLCCERKKFTYFNMDVFKIECNGDFKVSKKKKKSSAIFVAIFFIITYFLKNVLFSYKFLFSKKKICRNKEMKKSIKYVNVYSCIAIMYE